MTKQGKALPLSGVRILEFAGIGPAPFAAMLLADMGASILRIDRPGGADPWTDRVVRRNRISVTADLKAPEDLARVKALASRADALIEGFRPGVMERLGLGPEALLAVNPALVYGRMTGWGQDGPLALTAGHDINYIAITGALAAIGPAERPVPPLNLVGDLGGGALYLAMGLLAALLRARQTGEGQVVDCAISDCTISLMAMFSDLAEQGRWDSTRREGNILDGAAPFYRNYPCRDGRFVAVGALERPFYAALCQGLGLPVLPEAERMDSARWPEQIAAFSAVFLTRTRDEWAAHFAGTDACLAPVLTLGEAPDHSHNRARGAFVSANGAIQPAAAPRFSAAPQPDMALPPDLPSLDAALTSWP
ncbi:MAG: CaiB/BaiF CoA-transferase family protein [Beijerinckiaceae bacterium]|nr:CaiB/BaiF CoA-transferase family protein [Beijerinckiaceae bacterium]